VLAALFDGVVDLGDGPIKPEGNGRDLLVLRLDADGAIRWKRTQHLRHAQRVSALGVDRNGNVLYAGGITGGLPMGVTTPAPLLPDRVNLMLGKLDATGAPVFGKVFPSIVWQTPRLVVEPEGSFRVAATLHSHRIDVGGGKVGTEGGMLIARFDPAGAHVWSKAFGGRLDAVHDIALDERGDLFLIGETASWIDFGGGAVGDGAEDGTAPVVAKLDPSGAHLASRALIRSSSGLSGPAAQGSAIAVSPDGTVFVAGRILGGNLDLGGGPLGATAGDFAAALDASLGARWSTFTSSRERFEPQNHRLAVDRDGGLLLAYDVVRKLRTGGATRGLVVGRFAP